MDAPVVITPTASPVYLASLLGTEWRGLTVKANNLLIELIAKTPDGQIVGYELGAGGESAFLASWTITEDAQVVDPTQVLTLADGPLCFFYDAADAAYDETTTDRFQAAAVLPTDLANPFSSARRFQNRVIEAVTAAVGNEAYTVTWYGTRVAGTFGRRFMYMAMGLVTIEEQLLEIAALNAEAKRIEGDRVLREDPIARSLANRFRAIAKLPADTRERMAAAQKKRLAALAKARKAATPGPGGAADK